MQFKIKTQQLVEVLSTLVRVIPTKPFTAIMECVRFIVSDGTTLSITTADKDIHATRLIALDEPGTDGQFHMQAKLLLELVKTMPVGETVTFDAGEKAVTVEWSQGKASFPLFEGEHDTLELKGEPEVKVQFVQKELAEGIHGTIGSVAEDNIRPQLTGVFFDFGKDGTNMVATDARQLVIYNMPEKKNDVPFHINIYERNMRIVGACIADSDTAVDVLVYKNGVRFITAEGYDISMTQVTGKFPDYKGIIPKDNDSVLEADRAALIKALRRIGSCGDKTGADTLKFDLRSDGKVILSAQNLGFGTSAKETLTDVTYRGESFFIGFKGSMLADVLSTLTCEKVQLCMKGPGKPALVVPVQEGNKVFTGLVMPVLVK